MKNYFNKLKYYLIKKAAYYYYFKLGKIRTFFYTFLMAKTGRNIFIFPPFRCTSPEGITIGDNVNIANNTVIGGEGGVSIGNFVMIGANSGIFSSNHGFRRGDIPMLRQKPIPEPVVIKDDVWIGNNAIILPGITIGQGAIIGAGAVVTKDVKPYTIVGGNPARILRKRFSEKEIKILLSKNSSLYKYYKNDYLETNTPTIFLRKKD